jgi:hypothetical protein
MKQQDPNEISYAYEAQIFPKLTRLLHSEVLVVRQKAVAGLIELYLLKKENCVQSINSGVVEPLLNLLSDRDDKLRETSLVALCHLTNVKKGRDILANKNIVDVLKKLAENDTRVMVQVNALRVLEGLGAEWSGSELLYEECVPLLIEKSSGHQKDDTNLQVKTEALKVLYRALKIPNCDILSIKNEAVSVLTEILNCEKCRSSDELIRITCNVIALIAFNRPGLTQTVQCDTVYPLLHLLSHNDANVREACTNALMQITVSMEAKEQCVQDHWEQLNQLKEMIRNEKETKQNKINTLRLINNISEHPMGRIYFRDLIPALNRLKQEEEQRLTTEQGRRADLYECILDCIKVVSWDP